MRHTTVRDMAKLVDAIREAREGGHAVFGFEYFRPSTEVGVEKLLTRIEKMTRYSPTYVALSHAGGLAAFEDNVVSAVNVQRVSGVPVLLHMTLVGMGVEEVTKGLRLAYEAGVRNILATSGHSESGSGAAGESVTQPIASVADLVRLIRTLHGDHFCVGVTGHPGHSGTNVATASMAAQSLRQKTSAGADFIITDFFFEADAFLGWKKDVMDAGINLPIIASVLPIQVRIPAAVSTSLALIMSDQARVRDYGVSLAVSLLKSLAEACPSSVAVQFMTLNLEGSVERILKALNIVSDGGQGYRRRLPWRSAREVGREREGVRPIFWANRPQSYIDRTASWEQFPDSRWKDVRNRCGSCDERKVMWGDCPINHEDVFEVFARYISGGVASDDPTFGWGGAGGYVYQKAYVECFASPANLAKLMQACESVKTITYTAVDVRGNTYTNCARRGVNAVTWGVFPGKEVLQPTVVDYESFLAWKDEAFALWLERWASLYEEGSESHDLIHDIHDTFFLVNLVDNDVMRGDLFALFNSLIPDDIDGSAPAPCLPASDIAQPPAIGSEKVESGDGGSARISAGAGADAGAGAADQRA